MASHASAALGSGKPHPHPHSTVRALFFVTGISDPGLLPRLIEPVAKLGHVPTRMHASCESGNGSELSVDLRLNGLSRRTARLVESTLQAVVGVRQVLAVLEPDSCDPGQFVGHSLSVSLQPQGNVRSRPADDEQSQVAGSNFTKSCGH